MVEIVDVLVVVVELLVRVKVVVVVHVEFVSDELVIV